MVINFGMRLKAFLTCSKFQRRSFKRHADCQRLKSMFFYSDDDNTGWARKSSLPSVFAHVLVIFCLALVCILRRVFEQLVNSRAVTVLRYTGCNVVILMAAAAWLMSFSSCIVCGFD